KIVCRDVYPAPVLALRERANGTGGKAPRGIAVGIRRSDLRVVGRIGGSGGGATVNPRNPPEREGYDAVVIPMAIVADENQLERAGLDPQRTANAIPVTPVRAARNVHQLCVSTAKLACPGNAETDTFAERQVDRPLQRVAPRCFELPPQIATKVAARPFRGDKERAAG